MTLLLILSGCTPATDTGDIFSSTDDDTGATDTGTALAAIDPTSWFDYGSRIDMQTGELSCAVAPSDFSECGPDNPDCDFVLYRWWGDYLDADRGTPFLCAAQNVDGDWVEATSCRTMVWRDSGKATTRWDLEAPFAALFGVELTADVVLAPDLLELCNAIPPADPSYQGAGDPKYKYGQLTHRLSVIDFVERLDGSQDMEFCPGTIDGTYGPATVPIQIDVDYSTECGAYLEDNGYIVPPLDEEVRQFVLAMNALQRIGEGKVTDIIAAMAE